MLDLKTVKSIFWNVENFALSHRMCINVLIFLVQIIGLFSFVKKSHCVAMLPKLALISSV
jgi:hypothetical protein